MCEVVCCAIATYLLVWLGMILLIAFLRRCLFSVSCVLLGLLGCVECLGIACWFCGVDWL